MLGQAADAFEDGGLRGRHVLETGSGGHNPSLLRELVGPSGSVTTVDIDPDVIKRALACLAGAWDTPPTWTAQLTEDGVLVVPLRTFGMTLKPG